MPDVNPTSLQPDTRGATSKWRSVLSEPLLHFLAIGGLMFAASLVLAPTPDRSRIIEVTPAIRDEIATLFRTKQKRDPSEAELAPLLDNWVRTQILYREALSLGLDKGDEMIRERITHKMNLLIFSSLQVPQPTEAQLRAFFDANQARYVQPRRYDFVGLLLDGGATREQAEANVEALSAEDADPPAELMARVRPYSNRDRAGIAALFGPAFADSVTSMTPETWRALPIEQAGQPGWLVTLLVRVRDGKPADYDQVRPGLVDTWMTETGRAMANKAITDLAARYTIIRGPTP